MLLWAGCLFVGEGGGDILYVFFGKVYMCGCQRGPVRECIFWTRWVFMLTRARVKLLTVSNGGRFFRVEVRYREGLVGLGAGREEWRDLGGGPEFWLLSASGPCERLELVDGDLVLDRSGGERLVFRGV